MKKLAAGILFTILIFLGVGEISAQCRCAGVRNADGYISIYADAVAELNNRDAVFIGEVSEVKEVSIPSESGGHSESGFEITFKVSTAWKGVENDLITIQRRCSLEKGEKYLIYATLSDNILVVGCCCNRTKDLSKAAADLNLFNEKKLKPLTLKKNVPQRTLFETICSSGG